MISFSTSLSSVAGPSVATIFVLLVMGAIIAQSESGRPETPMAMIR
jgi:hypothetical protein